MKLRLSTLALFIVIAALSAALFIEHRRGTALRLRVEALETGIAHTQMVALRWRNLYHSVQPSARPVMPERGPSGFEPGGRPGVPWRPALDELQALTAPGNP